MKIRALDLGKFNRMCCFFDSKTRKHSFLNATTDRHYLSTIFRKHKIDLVVMEACGPSGWINSFRKPLAECSAYELSKGELDTELTQLDSLSHQLEVVVKKLEANDLKQPSDQARRAGITLAGDANRR